MPPKSTASTAAGSNAKTSGSSAAPKEDPNPHNSILQTINTSLTPPTSDEHWSSWYVESADSFADFKSYEPAAAAGQPLAGSGGSMRTLSARQISGQFDEEVAKSWEEDWEDEDVEDTFDHIMGQMSRVEASRAATGQS